MAEVRETELPGVGVRNDFVTGTGQRVGVLVHTTGRRDLLVYGEDDPDACRVVLEVNEDDARTIAELLGASRLTERLTTMQQRVRGLAIDWVPVEPGAPIAGQSLAGAQVHTNTGVSVVAIIRGDETFASPGAGQTVEVGDVVVAVGTESGMRQFLDLLAP